MVIGKIDTKDISVVVQGAIDKKYTPKCLESIRKHLPEAEIILSTWEGSDVKDLEYDILVINEIPNAVIHNKILNIFNNTNKQLLSTQNGLKKASKKYILKLRTDALLISNNFIKYIYEFKNRNYLYKIFNSRVIVSSVYSKEYSDSLSFLTPFYVSDFYFFGLKEDILDYFMETLLLTDDELGNYHHKFPNLMPYLNDNWKYTPEQYFCFSWANRKFNDIIFEDSSDTNFINYSISCNIVYNNFIFLDIKESGISNQKHEFAYHNSYQMSNLITFKKFIQQYNKISENNTNDYQIDSLSFLANNLIGYINFKTNIIIEQNSIIINHLQNINTFNKICKNIINKISNFIFSISKSNNYIIVKILGIKITNKRK